jgi:hypothetical protein
MLASLTDIEQMDGFVKQLHVMLGMNETLGVAISLMRFHKVDKHLLPQHADSHLAYCQC